MPMSRALNNSMTRNFQSRWSFVRVLALLTALMGAMAIPCLADDANPSTKSPTRWQQAADHDRALIPDIIWPTHEPLNFLLRRGDHYEDAPEQYAHMGDPDNIKRMADAGVRYAMIFFYKGFGLEYEKPAMKESKAMADEMHKQGIKVGLYIGGTMFTETLYHELPEAQNWEQRK